MNNGAWNHRIVNVLDQVPQRSQAQAKEKLTTNVGERSRAERAARAWSEPPS